VSKRLEYKVLKVSSEELETTLNIYAQDGFRAVHFFPPADGEVSLVISRKQKKRKQHHEVFEDDL
jgi:hypothetical protein